MGSGVCPSQEVERAELCEQLRLVFIHLVSCEVNDFNQLFTIMKVFFFSIYVAAGCLSAAGVNSDVVALTGCVSGLAFSVLVMRDIRRAWRACDK